MSIEKGRAYFRSLGIEDRVQEFQVSSATVELAAQALGVAPERQGRGLAKQLVRQAIHIARTKRQRALRLDVLGTNLPAQKLYTAMGFQYRTTLKLFYEDTGTTDYLLYELVL